jgi:hypothetical protein
MNVKPTSAVVCFAENATHLLKQMKCLDEKQIRLGTGGLTMAEYIEREKAMLAILKNPPDAHYPEWYARDIREIPSADVVEVVRCKDCRFSEVWGENCFCEYDPIETKSVSLNGYCSYGERWSDDG